MRIYDTLRHVFFFTREYAKRNERVIGDDGKYTHSLTRTLTHSITQM